MFGFAILLMAIQVQNSIEAETKSESLFDAQIARWKVQEQAADRDVALTQRVQETFMSKAESSGPTTTIAAANAALKPLRDRFPDFRLNYSKSQDYCPVVRAIQSARGAAISRKTAALNNQLHILAVKNAYLTYTIESNARRTLGKELTSDEFAQALIDNLESDVGKDEIQTDWNSMDYISSKTWAWDDCD